MVQTKIFSPDCIAINECGLHYSLARAGETADSPLVWERTCPFLQYDVLSTGHVKQTHPPMPVITWSMCTVIQALLQATGSGRDNTLTV